MEEFDLDQVEKPQLFLHALKSSGSNTEISALSFKQVHSNKADALRVHPL